MLIVLEGVDGSGKKTQADLLADHIRNDSRREVTVFEFPRYEATPVGDVIKNAQQGQYGYFAALTPELACMPYIVDRACAKEDLHKALSAGVVICNRYVESQFGYQCSKKRREEWDAFASWIERIEYDAVGSPRPDLILYLDTPPEVAAKLMKQRGVLDNNESDFAYQKKVGEVYRHFAETRPTWRLISCGNQYVFPKEVIHTRIWAVVEPLLLIKECKQKQ